MMRRKDACCGGVALMLLLLTLCCHAQQDQVVKGRQLFEQHQCLTCHGKDGTTPYNLRTRLDSLSDQDLKEFIKDPAAFGNRQMPAFKSILSDADIDALVTYVRALPEPGRKKRRSK